MNLDILDITQLPGTSLILNAASFCVENLSASMADRLEEKRRRLALLLKSRSSGPKGWPKSTKELEEAKAEHDKPIPTEILTAFPVPDVNSISWIQVQSVQERGKGRAPPKQIDDSQLKKHIESDGSPLPCSLWSMNTSRCGCVLPSVLFMSHVHISNSPISLPSTLYSRWPKFPTVFVREFPRSSCMNNTPLLTCSFSYVPSYISSFFSLPVKRESGERLTYEEVINRLDSETVSYEPSLGVGDQFCEVLRVSLKVEIAQYETAVAWAERSSVRKRI